MGIRVTTLRVPRFCHDGLVVGGGWTELDLAAMAPPARQALVDHVGRFVQIHPEDVAHLADHGLALVGGKLVPAPRRIRGTVEETESEPAQGDPVPDEPIATSNLPDDAEVLDTRPAPQKPRGGKGR